MIGSILMLWCVSSMVAAQRSADSMDEHIKAAQQAQASQDCHAAAREYGIVARHMPGSAEVWSNLAVALYCDEQFSEVIAASEKAIQLKPNLLAPHLFLGLSAYRLADYQRAVKELRQALSLHAADITAHIWLGYAYVSQSKYEAALLEFNEAVRLDPQNVDVRYALGQCYLELGRQKARELMRVAPQNGLVWQLAGEQYQLAGDQEKAQAALGEARKRTSLTKATPEQEVLYRQAHDAELASREAFQWLVDYAPESYRTHQVMAESLVARQTPELAVEEYRIVLKQNPGLPGVHQALSDCLMQGGRFADALAELRMEQRLQPRSAVVLTSIARVQIAMVDDEGAEKTLQSVTTMGQVPSETYLLLAKIKLRKDDGISAVALLNQYLRLSPNNSQAYYLLSRAYRTTGQHEKMIQAIETYKRTSQDEKERRLIQSQVENPSLQLAIVEGQETREPHH